MAPASQPDPNSNPLLLVGQEGSFDFYIKGDRGASPMAASSRPGASSIGEFIAAARFPPLKARSAGPARAGAAPAARACGLQAGTPLRGGARRRETAAGLRRERHAGLRPGTAGAARRAGLGSGLAGAARLSLRAACPAHAAGSTVPRGALPAWPRHAAGARQLFV